MRPRWGPSWLGATAVALALGFSGCVDTFLEPEPGDDPVSTFDVFWREFDRHYSFFDQKGVDWDAVRASHRPGITASTTPRELFQVFSRMADELRDGHVSINAPFAIYRYDDWFQGHPENFEPALAWSRLEGGPRKTASRNLTFGRLSADLGYVHVSTFGGEGWAGEMDDVLRSLAGIRGLVVDVRSNGGGTDLTSDAILGRFADRRRLYQYYRYRNGPDHDDFTDLIADHMEPEGRHFGGPVALLTNRRCFSAAEDFIMGMRVLESVVTLGDTTGGGMGNPILRELPNGWTFRLSRWQVFSPDRKPVVDGVGLAPDVFVALTDQDRARGIDTILEAAVDLLRARLSAAP